MFMVEVMFKRFIHTMCGLVLQLLSSLSNGSYGDRRLKQKHCKSKFEYFSGLNTCWKHSGWWRFAANKRLVESKQNSYMLSHNGLFCGHDSAVTDGLVIAQNQRVDVSSSVHWLRSHNETFQLIRLRWQRKAEGVCECQRGERRRSEERMCNTHTQLTPRQQGHLKGEH